MKKNMLLLFLLFSISLFAQAPPQGINYQGIARGANGKALSAQPISIKFDILDNTNTVVFTEQHVGLIYTNNFGLFTAVIGSQNNAQFQTINWSLGVHSIQVYIDTIAGGNNFMPIGVAQPFQSVPYALYAASAGGVNANTILSGNISPLPGTGNNGDFYIDILTYTFFGPKAGGAWPAGVILVGPIGPAGPQGPQGIQGIQGQLGPQGFPGVNGLLPNGAIAGNTPYWNGSNWVVNNSNVFNNGANVGIGNIAPNNKLDVTGAINSSLGYKYNNTAVQGKYLRAGATGYFIADSIKLADLPILPWGRSGNNVFTTNSSYKVGIGTNAPASLLTVVGSANDTVLGRFIGSNNFASNILISNTVNKMSSILLKSAGMSANIAYTPTGPNRLVVENFNPGGHVILGATERIKLNADTIAMMGNNGNGTPWIGIGTNSPIVTVDVRDFNTVIQAKAGNGGYAGFVADKGGSSQNGYILYRDFGIDLWAAGTKGNNNFTIYNWLTNADALIIDLNNNYVGIGTSNPGAKLTVAGASLWESSIGIQNTGGGTEWRVASDLTGDLKFVKIPGATFTALTLNGFNGNVTSEYFTKLGSNAPAIKTLKLTGTLSNTPNVITAVAHGLTSSKILSVDILVDDSGGAGNFMPPNYTYNVGFLYNFYITSANIEMYTFTTPQSTQVLGKPFKIIITYEQ